MRINPMDWFFMSEERSACTNFAPRKLAPVRSPVTRAKREIGAVGAQALHLGGEKMRVDERRMREIRLQQPCLIEDRMVELCADEARFHKARGMEIHIGKVEARKVEPVQALSREVDARFAARPSLEDGLDSPRA